MSPHELTRSLAATAIDFELTPAERAELEGHLASCSVCRASVDGLRADAAGIASMAVVEPPVRIRTVVLAAAAGSRPRAIHPWRLLAVAAILMAAIVGAALAVGAFDRHPSLVDVQPTPSPSTSQPPVAEPTSDASIVPADYTPPDPVCPAPSSAVPVPAVTVSVGAAQGQSATVWASGMTTCTTTQTDDGVPSVPDALLAAVPGDRFTLVAPPGWRFLRAKPTDAATTSHAIEGRAIEPTDRPSRLEVPVPPIPESRSSASTCGSSATTSASWPGCRSVSGST